MFLFIVFMSSWVLQRERLSAVLIANSATKRHVKDTDKTRCHHFRKK